MSQIESSSHEDRVNEAIASYLQAVERGEKPDCDAFLAQYPDIAAELASFLGNESQFQKIAGAEDVTPALTPTGLPPNRPPQQTDPNPDEKTITFRQRDVPSTRNVPRYFGDYELIQEIARGGMGVVYKARQVTLNRTVAVKMILAGQLAGPDDIQRFHTEAEAAAQLDHPGIVPIYEVGEHTGQHYFSMGFVDGQSLAKRVADGPLEPRVAAEILKAVAEAVQYAHDKGVIHRDLKPGNILLDNEGHPRVTDFGLAKLTESGSDLTGTGQVLGTPSFMPPEQAAAQVSAVGRLSDVYSLGAVLYCLLTGRPPFQAASPLETLMQVQRQDPVPPRQLNPNIPLDLDTIVLKCLDKSPPRRYASAKALAQELNRYLEGRPILARRVGRVERFWRWCKREPVVAGLCAAVAISLIVGTAVSAYFAVKERQRADSEAKLALMNGELAIEKGLLADENSNLAASEATQRKLATDRASELQATLAQNFFERGIHEFDDGKTNGGLSNLIRAYAMISSESPIRAGYRRVLVDRCTFGGRLLVPPLRHAGKIVETAYSSDRTWLVTACDDKTARMWDAKTGLPIGRVMHHDLPIQKIMFNSAETRVITISSAVPDSSPQSAGDKIKGRRIARVWDALTGAPIGTEIRFMYFAGQYQPPFRERWKAGGTSDFQLGDGVWSFLHFTNDRTHAVSIQDNIAQLWNMEAGTQVGDPIIEWKMIKSIGFNPDGSRLFTADEVLQAHPRIYSLYGNLLSGAKKVVHVWDCQTGTSIGKPLELETKARIEFNDEMSLAAVINGSVFRTWNTRDMSEHSHTYTHADEIKKLMFSPEGTRIACAGGATVSLFDVQIGSPIGQGLTHDSDVRWLEFSPKGNQIVTQTNKVVSLWSSVTGQIIGHPTPRELSTPDANERGQFKFNAAGSRLAFLAGDHVVVIDTATGDLITNVVDDYKTFHRVWFSPDGTRLITKANQFRIWDSATGKPLGKKLEDVERTPSSSRDPRFGFLDPRFSPDGAIMLVIYIHGKYQLWDLNTGMMLPELETLGSEMKLDRRRAGKFEFSFDGSLLLLHQGSLCLVIEAKTGDPLGLPYTHETLPSQANFILNASAVATTCGNCVYLWDVNGRRPASSHIQFGRESEGRDSLYCTFSHDSRLVVTEHRSSRQPKAATRRDAAVESDDGAARLWDAQTGKPIGEAMPHDSSISSVIFSPDDERLLTVKRVDRTSTTPLVQWQLWDARTGSSIGNPIEAVGERASFSRDGSIILVANVLHEAESKTSRQWSFYDGRTAEITGNSVTSIDERPIGWISDLKRLDHYRLQFARPPDPERHLQFNHNDSQFVTVVDSHTVQVFNPRTGKAMGDQIRHDLSSGFGFVSAVFSPGDDQIVSVSTPINKSGDETDNTVIQIWDSVSRKRVGSETQIEGIVEQLQFSSDGRRLRMLVSGDVVILDTLTCGIINRNTVVHGDASTRLALCPDGVHILGTNDQSNGRGNATSIALFDDKSLIWKWESQSPSETFMMNDRYGGVAISPDGTRFMSQTVDDQVFTMRFWDGLTGALLGNNVNLWRRTNSPNKRFTGSTDSHQFYFRIKLSPDFKFALGFRNPDWEAFVWDTSVSETDHVVDSTFVDAIALWTGFRADANGKVKPVREHEFNELQQRFQQEMHPFEFGRRAKSFSAKPALPAEEPIRQTDTDSKSNHTDATDDLLKESTGEQRPVTDQELARIQSAPEVAAVEEAKRTSRRLTNVDLSQGFDGWRVSGDVYIGKPITVNGAVTVGHERSFYPGGQLKPPGRLAQSFVIPDDVSELRFFLLTGARYFQIALWHGNQRCYVVDKNSEFSTADRVRWDVNTLRGEVVTLEIVIEHSALVLPTFILANNPDPTLSEFELSYVNRNHVIVTHRFSDLRSRKISSPVGIPRWIQWSEVDQRMLVLVEKKLIRLDTNGSAEEQVLWEWQDAPTPVQSDESENVLAVSHDEKRIAWLQKESPDSTNAFEQVHLRIQEIGKTNVFDVGEGKNPMWTRDGKLLFEGSQTSSRLANWNGESIVEIPIASSRTGAFPTPSPNGKMIAFETRAKWIPANGQIALIDADGTNFRLVTATGSRINRAPVFSPDSRYIAFLRGKGISKSSQKEEKSSVDPFEVVIFDVETERETIVATDALGIRPSWRRATSNSENTTESESIKKPESDISTPSFKLPVVDASLGKNSKKPDKPPTISEFELIYVKFADFRQTIVSYHCADGVERLIPYEKGRVLSFEWNEGSQKMLALVVNRDLPPNESILLRLSIDGTGLEETFWAFKSIPKSVSVSPDLQRLAWLDTEEGKNIPHVIVQELNANSSRNLGPGYDPIWSADGQKLIYLSAGDGWKIAIADAKSVIELSPSMHSTGAVYPCPSPDGKLIAYGAKGRDGTRQIGLVSTEEPYNEPKIRQVTNNTRMNELPAFSPDGRYIAYLRANRSRFELAYVDLETDRETVVADDVRQIRPVWRRIPDPLIVK